MKEAVQLEGSEPVGAAYTELGGDKGEEKMLELKNTHVTQS